MRVLEDHQHELRGPLPAATQDKKDRDEGDGRNLPKKVDPELIQDLKARLRDREARIAELENSLSWKITAK